MSLQLASNPTRLGAPLQRPIFIIGAARSGTTILSEIIALHHDIAYWVEPKYIWRYGRPMARDDRRAAHEATPKVSAYIHARLAAYVRAKKKSRFMEKTPSNCFRVPFMYALFPDGLFLHLVRDGRDVAFSAREKWRSPPARSALWRRTVSMEIPLRDVLHYTVDFARDVVGRQLRPQDGFIWGPHFHGIREIRSTHTLLETCAIQWRESVNAALSGLQEVPLGQQLTVRFEDLLEDPPAQFRRILDFLELPFRIETVEYAHAVLDHAAIFRWRGHDPQVVESVMPHIEPLLRALDYPVDASRTPVVLT